MTGPSESPFASLEWSDDELTISGVRFALSHPTSEGGGAPHALALHKTRRMVDQYAELFAGRPEFRPRNVFELGILDGGSLAFWFELFQPDRLVGVDILTEGDPPQLQAWAQERGIGDRLATYWGVNQADASRIGDIITTEGLDPLDLVIDDASHLYEPTRASFNAIFGRLRAGGLYVIEDWKSEHLAHTRSGSVPRGVRTLVDIIQQIIRSQAGAGAIRTISVHSNFVAIERAEGPAPILEPVPLPADIRVKRRVARALKPLRRRRRA